MSRSVPRPRTQRLPIPRLSPYSAPYRPTSSGDLGTPLRTPHIRINTPLLQQNSMRAALHRSATFNHNNFISVHNRREPMRNHESRNGPTHGTNPVKHGPLCLHVQRRSCLVKHEYPRTLEYRSRNTDPLPFSSRKLRTTLPHYSVVAFRKRHHDVMDLSNTCRALDLFNTSIGTSDPNVDHDRFIEQSRVLRNYSHTDAQFPQIHTRNCMSVEQNLPDLRFQQPRDQTGNGRFAGPTRPDDSKRLPRPHCEGDPLKHHSARPVGRAYTRKFEHRRSRSRYALHLPQPLDRRPRSRTAPSSMATPLDTPCSANPIASTGRASCNMYALMSTKSPMLIAPLLTCRTP